MRNWNKDLLPVRCRERIVISLPMRNWNFRRVAGLGRSWWKLLVYLWGIETCIMVAYAALPFKLLVYLWGIETRTCRRSFWDRRLLLVYLWGIETTTTQVATRHQVKLLVYLWGIETGDPGETPGAGILLLVYLWGIETTFHHLQQYFFAKLLVYLWGIETIDTITEDNKEITVISLPMRNWNEKEFNIETEIQNLVISLPMRNWNNILC